MSKFKQDQASTQDNQEPMIKLQPGGVAPVLSYNVPEPTAYSGRNFIDLQLPDHYFINESASGRSSSLQAVSASQAQGESSPEGTYPQSKSPVQAQIDALLEAKASGERMTEKFQSLTPEDVLRKSEEGKKLNITRTLTGAYSYVFYDKNAASEPLVFASPSAEGEVSESIHESQSQAGAFSSEASLRRLPQVDDEGGIMPLRPIEDQDPEPEPDPVLLGISITAPAPEAVVSGTHSGTSLTIQGQAWMDSGLGSVSRVRVQVGSGAAYQAASFDPSTGAWSLSGVVITSSGRISITAEAVHSAGKVKASRTIHVQVNLAPAPDITLPAIAITSPTAGQLLTAGESPVVNLVVEGTASDDRGVARVEIILNNEAPIQADSGDGYAHWKKTIAIHAGTHAITAKAYDAANNAATTSLTVSVDSTPPTIGITSPQNSAELAGTFTQGCIIEVLGTAADAGGIQVVEVSLDQVPVYVRAAENGPDDWSQWKATLKVTEPGIHIITARAVDRANNKTETTVAVNVNILPEVNSRLKRIILVESYRMSSYLANYGAGRTIKTFSLLPGERSKISIRSYAQNETTAKSAATILDSVTDEISEEFENSIAREQADKKNYNESNEYKIEGEAGVSWGWGSASISAGYSGGTNSAREQFAKNVVNTTQKHVAKASARRDVQINTTYEEKSTTTEETAIIREFENINMSRTLNFVFRQMNQEFITFLHLVDVRIGFFRTDTVNGEEKNTYQEVTLPQLDALLAQTIVADKRIEVRNAILHQLTNIFDYQDRHHSFVEEEPFLDENGQVIPLTQYLRVKKDYVSTYESASGSTIDVPGIILAANRHVLRTDGIVVEALLGQGEALDTYSRNLQSETVREKELRNTLLETEIQMRKLALQILENRDQVGAEIFNLINHPPQVQESNNQEATGTQQPALTR
ncbi:Ig-like domain-containing protein [Paenibacillus sp. GCM10023252]|uniref:Ig-like domain-containing protein n=1 Tax=Paenibacillus sp. GCM10023252 TaxID=3252649 RepID=UPI0036174094